MVDAAVLLAGALGFYRCRCTDIETRREGWTWARHKPSIKRPLARFVVIRLYTGTRHGPILSLQRTANINGGWIDLVRSVMHRRDEDTAETKKRQPPVRVGRRLPEHFGRWKKIDELARYQAAKQTTRSRLPSRRGLNEKTAGLCKRCASLGTKPANLPS